MDADISWRAMRPEAVSIDATHVPLPNQSRRVLLVLLLEANRTVPADRIAEALWGDEQPKTARNSISRFVVNLRRSLGPAADRIVSSGSGYRVVVYEGELDQECVESSLERARASLAAPDPDLTELVAVLSDANELAGGRSNPVLQDLYGYEAQERVQVELRVRTIEALGDALLRQHKYTEVVSMLETAVDQHPYHEVFWYQMMRAFDRSGRAVDALTAAERLRELLSEIGVAPIENVLELEAEIRERDSSANGRQVEAAPPEEPADGVTSAPFDIADPRTSLIGRAEELQTVHQLIDQHRSVSIVGLGGTGKTRVALGVSRVLQALGGQVYHVGLRDVNDREAAVPIIASVLGVTGSHAATATGVATTMARHEFTLVLDNCEHLRETCCEITNALLEHAPKSRTLLTSREPLGIPDEVVYTLHPLPTPAAAELLIDRAHAWLPASFDEAEVNEICELLRGLPLAIEIAAAQVAYMTPTQLLDKIRQVSAPGSGARVTPALSAVDEALDWSWSTLSPNQKALLARLSIFESGWTLAAAEAVCAGPESIEPDLAQLVSSCLVNRNQYDTGIRYEILAPVREYAVDRLADRGETEAMADRLATWAQSIVADTTFMQANIWAHTTAALFPERGNIAAAIRRLEQQGRKEELVMLAVRASGMMINMGFGEESARWLGPYVDDLELSDRVRSASCAALSASHHSVGEFEGMGALAVKGLELAAGEPYDWVPVMAGYFAVWSLVAPVSIPTEALYQIAVDAAEHPPKNKSELMIVALYRGQGAIVARNYEAALGYFQTAKELAEHPGRALMTNEAGESIALYLLGRLDEARASVEQWVSRSDTDHWHYKLDVFRAIINGATGTPEQATAELAAAVRSYPPARTFGRAGIVQTAFAILADFRGEHDLADTLFASAVNRDTMLLPVCIEHLMKTRDLSGDAAWLEVGLEFWNRIVPEGSAAATAASTPQLLAWWTTGDTTPAN